MEEIGWGGIADFYFCHGGSMQHKMGWIHRVAGVVHSNKSFAGRYNRPRLRQPNRAEAIILPQSLVVDDDPTRYTPLQLARADQNYHFPSTDQVVQFILGAFRKTSSLRYRTVRFMRAGGSVLRASYRNLLARGYTKH
jgi:hypothetical protein